ncbi:hypothetical protein FRACYDRAFT_250009 [Fragilariopsis cylindrus CCMP1102]|uniref:Uncharacterized protein n=1 Tax=Fragilariopsis cylindrus CCMP1102 TaxID=635003 RepID=A0A1E7EQK9_9STRA|nr:hypothetical protein FRACYDRAFT_250009 [Fragilariopsis cylindrus CCMP1102]|eukprot:OEU08222.1 hypothetical protein FRACYDRAFT_250009 [Fragilariopsis cylindrus CCMP1102]
MKFTAAAAITLLGLTIFSSTTTINCVKANELKLRAREKMRKDRAERQLQANDAGLVFSRGYICITRQQDFAFVIPQQKSTVPAEFKLLDLNLLGSSTIQSGGIYDPADVQIVDRLGTSAADNFDDDDAFIRDKQNRGQFAGQRQPKFIPQKDPGFFFNGECVATQAAGPQILGHSCLLNLCLGGGTIIGGTGLFVGAVGYVDVTTITGGTLTPAEIFDDDDFSGSVIGSDFPQAGYITQKINVVTNVPLPVAP